MSSICTTHSLLTYSENWMDWSPRPLPAFLELLKKSIIALTCQRHLDSATKPLIWKCVGLVYGHFFLFYSMFGGSAERTNKTNAMKRDDVTKWLITANYPKLGIGSWLCLHGPSLDSIQNSKKIAVVSTCLQCSEAIAGRTRD